MLSHPRSKATKDHEGTEESKYYDTINEGPTYEAVGEGQNKTGGGDGLILKLVRRNVLQHMDQHLQGMPPCITSAGGSLEYETIREPGSKAGTQQNPVSTYRPLRANN